MKVISRTRSSRFEIEILPVRDRLVERFEEEIVE
jgi:hypothetical protein